MKTYRVVIADAALDRIREQVRYIAVECHAPENARRWLTRVLAAAETLETMPERCAKAIESAFRPFEIRALNIDGYLLLFVVNEEDRTVLIVNARHGRQLPRPDDLPEAEPGSTVGDG